MSYATFESIPQIYSEPTRCWRKIQRDNFTSWEALAEFLQLSPDQCERLIKKHPFILNLPRRLASKIKKGTLDDPILKQFVPLHSESSSPSHFEKDPVKDTSFCLTEKLLQKYEKRALLLCSSACAMHCRFCFRQHFPYEKERKNFHQEIEQIKQDPSLKELILSGGDPLSLSNSQLSSLIEDLSTIEHLSRIRFHSRFPIGIPERIDDGFLKVLESTRLQVWFILHCNHPSELDSDVLDALKSIQKLGIPVMNQSVLLKDINDSTDVLYSLFDTLIKHGIVPYYLHQLDYVEGAQAFEVPEEKGHLLIEELRAKLPGYGVPLYVKETPGKKNKTPIFSTVD